MRKSHRLVSAIVVVVAVLGLSAIGQEEPLPVVKARAPLTAETQANADAGLLLVDLPAEPIIPFTQPTLAGAAAANDFATFDALYREQRTPAYADLHTLWTYALTDPIGAFYGADMHERLSRTYPNFAEFIARYRIVDQNGHSFYPTAESRSFLLQYATSGEPVRFALGTASERSLSVATGASLSVGTGASLSVGTGASLSVGTGASPVQRRRAGGAHTETAKPAQRSSSVGAGGSPARRRQAGGAHTEAARVEAPVVAEPIVAQTPIVATPVPAPAPVIAAPVAAAPIAAAPHPVPAPVPAKPAVASDSFTGRGILLLIVGILGIGVLTLMLRTPKEDDEPVIDAEPVAKVEPFTKPQEKTDAPRATGSHG